MTDEETHEHPEGTDEDPTVAVTGEETETAATEETAEETATEETDADAGNPVAAL